MQQRGEPAPSPGGVEAHDASEAAPVEVTFVLPCLNEAETLAPCLEAAWRCIRENGLAGEVVVADNGSEDGSPAIAERHGARVVHVAERGYGAALMGGCEAARGRFIVMGDADQSYDFGAAMPFVEKLRAGADLVMGSRFRGRIEPGAMPWHHRWIGNPVLSFVGRLFFRTGVSDFHCGLRGLSRDAYERMGLRTTGMEFASEMVVKASVQKMRIAEVPIVLRPDARTRAPHLRSFRDGWRHLRFLMILSPRWTLFVPGLAMALVGAGIFVPVWLGPVQIGRVELGVHTLLAASLLLLVGYQTMTIALAARIYAVEEEVGPPAPWLERAFGVFTLEKGLVFGALLVLAGLGCIAGVGVAWARTGFGELDAQGTLRWMVAGVLVAGLGAQTLLVSFVYSMLGVKRRRGR